MTGGPLIVQSDKTLLLEVEHPDAEQARRDIAPFAELERAPEHDREDRHEEGIEDAQGRARKPGQGSQPEKLGGGEREANRR